MLRKLRNFKSILMIYDISPTLYNLRHAEHYYIKYYTDMWVGLR